MNPPKIADELPKYHRMTPKIADYTTRKLYGQDYAKANREAIKDYQKNYAKENREAINARKKAWRAARKDQAVVNILKISGVK